MKGKKKDKKKTTKVVLLCMGFLLTIVLTFTATLAWFYDSDWASNHVTMAGAVGIEIRDNSVPGVAKSGSGNLHFDITTDKAYPGQAIDISACVYNNGGSSGSGGSQAYIRAHFAVYTDIGLDNPDTEDIDESLEESELNSQTLYNYLNNLIASQNAKAQYQWKYYKHTNSIPLSTSGTQKVGSGDEIPDDDDANDIIYYLDGKKYTETKSTGDRGYYYLCYKEGATIDTFTTPTTPYEVKSTDFILKPLAVNDTAAFLWNDQLIIPWTLTNYSADKHIFVAIVFQAVQTYIPLINTDGSFLKQANNQLAPELCTYDNHSVQAVFNSSTFKPIDTKIYAVTDTNGDGKINKDDATDRNGDLEIDDEDFIIDFGDATKFAAITAPDTDASIK